MMEATDDSPVCTSEDGDRSSQASGAAEFRIPRTRAELESVSLICFSQFQPRVVELCNRRVDCPFTMLKMLFKRRFCHFSIT